jgi:hypothetical protein
MYREILESIRGVGIFPVLSLLIFSGVFSMVLFAASRLTPARLAEFARMPLDQELGKGDDREGSK